MKYAQQKGSKRRVYITIALAWLISILIASPLVLGINKRPTTLAQNSCLIFNSEFLFLSSFGSFYLPTAIMVPLYIKILIIIWKHSTIKKNLSRTKVIFSRNRLSRQQPKKRHEFCKIEVDADSTKQYKITTRIKDGSESEKTPFHKFSNETSKFSPKEIDSRNRVNCTVDIDETNRQTNQNVCFSMTGRHKPNEIEKSMLKLF